MKKLEVISILTLMSFIIIVISGCAPREYTYCWDSKTEKYRHCKKGETPGQVKNDGVQQYGGNN